MEQRCALVNVWLAWLGIPLVAMLVGWRVALRAGWLPGILVAVLTVGLGVWFQVVYIRSFPRVSRFLGYGGVEDVAASSMPSSAVPLPRVMFYTASACPFCPLVRDRLAGLQKTLGFEMEEVDVTFRPDLIRAKGLRSVPVVEAGAEILVGNATSQQLAAFLQRAAAAAPTA